MCFTSSDDCYLQREMLLLRSEVDSAKAEAAAAVEEVKRVEELRKADQSLISSAAASKREAEEVRRYSTTPMGRH